MLCPIYQFKQSHPKKIAIHSNMATLTYEELDKRIQQLCTFLVSLKLPDQSRVAFIAPLTIDTICLFFALWRSNHIACPLSEKFPPEQVQEILKQLQPHYVFDFSQFPKNSSSFYVSTQIDGESLATIISTSGTTQRKFICHQLKQHLASAFISSQYLNLGFYDHYLLSLPLHHISGIAAMMRTFLVGATLTIEKNIWEAKATHLSCVPTQLFRLLEGPSSLIEQAKKLKCMLLGGAPIPIDLYHLAMKQGFNLYLTYGMTEAASMITLKSPESKEYHLGKPLPHLEMQINEKQEILIRGNSMLYGYWDSDSQCIRRFSQEAWFETKDLGSWTKDGNLQFFARKDRMFISGGENIYPEEIESALSMIPEIKQAIVYPESDIEFGMRPVAYLYAGRQYSLEELKVLLKNCLPSFKYPKRVVYLERPYHKDEIKTLIS